MPGTDRQRLGTREPLSINWDENGWLAGDALSGSEWSVSPGTGLTLSGQNRNGNITATFREAVSPGTYRVTNTVTTAAGATYSDEILIAVEGTGFPTTAYLTTDEAEARLFARYGVEANLTAGDLEAASEELDSSLGPFIGYRQTDTQTRAFPRSINPDRTPNTNAVTPERILDAVALLAYHIAEDEGPAITGKSVLDRSITYATPKESQTVARIAALIRPYQRRVGSRL